MVLTWTSRALSDLVRLYEFLAPVNRRAAVRTVRALTAAPSRLLDHPRIGEQLEEFAPREVRRLLAGQYEMRYEIEAPCSKLQGIFEVQGGKKSTVSILLAYPVAS